MPALRRTHAVHGRRGILVLRNPVVIVFFYKLLGIVDGGDYLDILAKQTFLIC